MTDLNVYDSEKYDLNYVDKSRRGHKWNGSRTTRHRRYFFANGEAISGEKYHELQDYNKYRDISNEGMTQQITSPIKKRKNLFLDDNLTTTFGN